MTLLLIDGFDHYTVSQMIDKYSEYASGGLDMVGGRFGGQAFHSGSQSQDYVLNFEVNKSTIYFGVAIKKMDGGVPTLSTSYPFLYFLDESGAGQVKLCVNLAMGINVYRGDNTLLGSTGDAIFENYKWCYLEIKVTISDTVGEVTIRINENQVLNLTSQDTKNAASDYIRKIRLAGIYSSQSVYFDDMYVDDAQFHGDCRIRTFMPDSISSTNNSFTASAGNKDECVDETLSNDDTDYIYSDTLNHKQGFGITTGALGTVKAIQLNNHCRIDEAGTRQITPLIRSNSTDYLGTETENITADYLFESEIWETDPDDSNPWTQTKLEAAEFGLEITT